MDMTMIIVFLLVAIATGGAFYALAYPALSGNSRVEKRQKAIYGGDPGARISSRGRETNARRNQVAASLKEIEERQKQRRTPPLTVRLQQAGLDWSKRKFVVISLLIGLGSGLLVQILVGMPLIAFAAVFVAALGLPRWLLGYLTKRRQMKFLEEFPNAIDIIVRGVKSGLPLGDCMRIAATDTQDPVKSEFRTIVEMQTVGVPVGEAVGRMYERIGVTEANFFGIVIAIQQKSGGSLSEALGNLSKVLRDRRKMKARVQALSSEAKSSATIIAALPVIVAGLVYVVNPDYIALLWQTTVGTILLGICAFWMMCGVVFMRRMINFDY